MLHFVLLSISIVLIVFLTAKVKIHPFLALLTVSFVYGIGVGMPLTKVVDSINLGFGATVGQIGIIIIAGTIIGVFLEKSGGAFAIADAILRWTGRDNAPLGMSLIGYIVSIPVFCDSGFVILSPLTKALAARAQSSYISCCIALALGLYASHTMVPPTPGPIAAAGILEADLGLVIGYGLLVSSLAMLVGWLYSITWAARFIAQPEIHVEYDRIDQLARRSPSALCSSVPIIIPLVLIVLHSVAKYPTHPFGDGFWYHLALFAGSPIVALLIGMVFSFFLPARFELELLSSSGWVGEALKSAAIIILITGAGGAFGNVLKNSEISDSIGGLFRNAAIGIWLPFILASTLKTAQGSSTVAITATAALIAPLTGTLGLETPSQIALAIVMIGAGSMVVSHANDSYFWVVTQFSNMNLATGYQAYSLGTLIEGLAAGCIVWLIVAL